MEFLQTFVYAFFVGLLPALIWLWFWLHEDKSHPEPRSILAFTFTTGMAMIFFAIPLESFFYQTIPEPTWRFLVWAAIEEILKFSAVAVAALHRRTYDEPIDAAIYMICGALGFAALENTLFLLHNSNPELSSIGTGVLSTVFITNLRFIGANLLHVVASSTIGVAIAWSFYKPKKKKVFWILGGLAAAIILHTLFNLFIIDGSSGSIFLIFSIVWLIMIGFILVFERIKKMSMPIERQLTQQ